MKYILTSSLNIDNILSTESISPMSFYGKRSFGYRHFVQLDELRDCDPILLFDIIPSFCIEDKQRDNYPMVVGVDDDGNLPIKVVGEVKGNKIYACYETIRITPMNANLLFFTDKARVLSYHNCLDSKLCKLVDYFKLDIVVPGNISLRNIVEHINIPLSHVLSVGNDNRYDKGKGLIFGYYLGTVKSLSPNVARMLAIQRRIYDIVSTIENNGGLGNTLFYDELKSLDSEYMELDPNIAYLKKEWQELAEQCGVSSEGISKFLRAIGTEAENKRKFCLQKGIILHKNLSEYRYSDIVEYRDNLSLHIKSVISREKSNAVKRGDLASFLDVNPEYMVMMTKDDENSSLFNKILNFMIWDNLLSSVEDLRINRSKIAEKVTLMMKNIVESERREWNGSKEQAYFHHLRLNISEYTPFNPKEVDNVVLQSLSAFLLKGEDFDALINYIEINSISVYQYALALWGVTLGYTQIPRSTLFSLMSKESFPVLYKVVYELMNHRKLNVFLSEYKGLIDVSRPPAEKQCDKTCLDEKRSSTDAISNKNNLGWKDKARLCVNAMRILKDSYRDCAIRLLEDRDVISKEQYLRKLSLEKGWKTGKAISRLKEALSEDLFNSSENCVFPVYKGVSKKFDFNHIDNVIAVIKGQYPDLSKKVIEYLKKDLEWVLDPEYSTKSAKKNIEKFKEQLYLGLTTKTTKNGKSMEWKNKAYQELDIENVIEFLHKLYDNG